MNENSHTEASPPKAFLSYTSSDRILAKRIADILVTRGVAVWWDQWEIRAGDSIVQRISEGLDDCTHFIVLLTPRSIKKPWVSAEIDAAFVRRMNARVKLIPLRCDLPAKQLPPLLSALHSPEVTKASLGEEVAQLASDIHGVTRRPGVHDAPNLRDYPPSPYSRAAMIVAKYFCRETENAATFDPIVELGALAVAIDLSLEDTLDGLHELQAFIREQRTLGPREGSAIWPLPAFWPEFDQYFDFNAHDPASDARIIAARVLNDPDFPERLSEIADVLGWQPRRINPAAAYLMDRDIVRHHSFLGMGPWVVGMIHRTGATRRFVKAQV